MVNTLTVDNEAKQTIEALQTELQKTKEKLKAVEELKSQSGMKPCSYSGCKGVKVMFQKESVIKARGVGGGEWVKACENGSSICSININTEWRAGPGAVKKLCLGD